MKKIKLYISILEQVDLNPTEKLLFEVNLKLLRSKYTCVRKVAREGIENLLNQVHFRLSIINLLKGSTVWSI